MSSPEVLRTKTQSTPRAGLVLHGNHPQIDALGAEALLRAEREQKVRETPDFAGVPIQKEAARKFRVTLEIGAEDEAAAISLYEDAQQHTNDGRQNLQQMFSNYGSYEKTTKADHQTNFEIWFEGDSYHSVQKVIKLFEGKIKNLTFTDA
jgi:hypothetical protein